MCDMEFSIALALSAGIRHMALIVHNKCIMSDPSDQKDAFVRTLTEAHEWSEEKAESFFDLKVGLLEIEDPVEFALEETKRLSVLFPQLFLVPLLYNVDNDRLFLIKDWLLEQKLGAVTAKLLGIPLEPEVLPTRTNLDG